MGANLFQLFCPAIFSVMLQI
uniref:Uncharacterized protein n=1 Tax=Rhodnius prolixus TaxID=13249 RepID=T1HM69_RHOPR